MMKNMEQVERFKDAARKLGADESNDTLDRVMGKLDLRKKPDPKPEAEKQEGK